MPQSGYHGFPPTWVGQGVGGVVGRGDGRGVGGTGPGGGGGGDGGVGGFGIGP